MKSKLKRLQLRAEIENKYQAEKEQQKDQKLTDSKDKKAFKAS